jgi:hypothetical protein
MLWKGFQKPKRLATDTSSLTDKYGMFWAQPFERGFGTTVGNALRRVLLSSIEGAAVTAVKMEGVLHEFQSIPGVVEDATDIILNLKQIPFKLSGDAPKAIYLRADQPGVVTSGMIEADGDVEVLDKDVYIATVSEGGKLDMEMRLKRGRGYTSADKNFDEDLGIGFIPIDSVHSPVRKCNYTVEAARLGQITDYDKLDQRLHHARRFARPGREAAEGPHEHLHQLRGRNRDRSLVVRRSQARDSQREPQPFRRRTRAFRTQLQLPEEREHPDHWGARTEDRSRNAEDEEFRPQIAERDQGDSFLDGSEPGHED